MAATLTIDDSRAFRQEARLLIGAGAVSGVVVTLLHLVAGAQLAQLTALSFGAILGLAVNLVDDEEGTPTLRLALAIGGGAAMALLWPVHVLLAAAVGGAILGGAFCLGEGRSAAGQGAVWAMYGFCLAAGVYTTTTLGQAMDASWAQNLFEGASWGLFLAFAAGVKRLRSHRDPILGVLKEARAELAGEEREAVLEARALYERIVQELQRVGEGGLRDRAEEVAAEAVRALVALTRRGRDLRRAAEATADRQLQGRIDDLERRIARTDDATVRAELRSTLAELTEQVRVRRRFDVAAARLEARQQRCFTALERLHVALVQSSGDSGADATVADSIESLERLADELHWRNLSIDELVDEDPVSDDSVGNEDEEEGAGVRLDTAPAEAEAPVPGGALDQAPPGTDGTLEVEEAEAHDVHTQHHSR